MRALKYKINGTALCALFLFVSSCATAPEWPTDLQLQPPSENPQWDASGVDGIDLILMDSKTLPVGGAAVSVNLDGLEFVLTPPDRGDGETRSDKTSLFAEKNDLHIAVNASPFDPVDILNRKGRPVDVIGIQMDHGQLVSQAEERYDALYLLDNGSVVLDSQKRSLSDVRQAVGGFKLLMKDDEILAGPGARHPRSALGIDQDANRLIIAVFDGRQRDRAGLSLEETALWMRWLGCSDALNLDGGGSSSLVLKTKKGTVQILNSPIHRGRPGLERAVGNNLGIRLPEAK